MNSPSSDKCDDLYAAEAHRRSAFDFIYAKPHFAVESAVCIRFDECEVTGTYVFVVCNFLQHAAEHLACDLVGKTVFVGACARHDKVVASEELEDNRAVHVELAHESLTYYADWLLFLGKGVEYERIPDELRLIVEERAANLKFP